MSIIAAIKQRRAVRKYEAREVEKEKVIRLLETAVWSPNDRLRQPWHFYVISGDAKQRYAQIAEQFLVERFPTKPNLVEESLKVLHNIPLLIVVTADMVTGDTEASQDNEYAACCAAYSIWLAAEELGLGCVWRTRGIGLVRDQRLYDFIGSPDNRKIIGTLCLGYAAETPVETTRHDYAEKTTWLDK